SRPGPRAPRLAGGAISRADLRDPVDARDPRALHERGSHEARWALAAPAARDVGRARAGGPARRRGRARSQGLRHELRREGGPLQEVHALRVGKRRRYSGFDAHAERGLEPAEYRGAPVLPEPQTALASRSPRNARLSLSAGA